MIIWGSRGVERTDRTGEFHCPECRGSQPYKLKSIQRFFTLYFIPLFPLGETAAQWVECGGCRQQFRTVVLDHNPEQDRIAADTAIADYYNRILCHFGQMSGRKDADFQQEIGQLFQQLECGAIPMEEVAKGLDRDNNIGPAVVGLGRYLNDRGREIVARNALALATANGGPLSDEIRAELSDMAIKLGMTETHLAGVFASWEPRRLIAPPATAH